MMTNNINYKTALTVILVKGGLLQQSGTQWRFNFGGIQNIAIPGFDLNRTYPTMENAIDEFSKVTHSVPVADLKVA